LRAESKLPSNRKIRFILRTDEKLISSQIPTLTRLLNAEEVELDPKYQAQSGNPVAVTPLGEIFLTVAAADRAGERSGWIRKLQESKSKCARSRKNWEINHSSTAPLRPLWKNIGGD